MNTIQITEKNGSVTQYVRDHNGVIKQLYPKPFTYNADYCATYDTPAYKRQSQTLQRLRLGFTEASWGSDPIMSLLDCGYGNGAFLRYASGKIYHLFGYDVSGVPVPRDVTRADRLPVRDTGGIGVDVITFWDCLEHFPDLSFLATLHCRMIVVSLPWCHYDTWLNRQGALLPFEEKRRADALFTDWHHRKPDEHLHHFDKESLVKTMKMYGWGLVFSCNIEDAVRKGKDAARQNILTASFKRLPS